MYGPNTKAYDLKHAYMNAYTYYIYYVIVIVSIAIHAYLLFLVKLTFIN